MNAMQTTTAAARRLDLLRSYALMLSLALGAPSALRAAFLWDGGGSDNDWLTGANWSPDGAPAGDGSASLTFSGNTRTATTNDFTANTGFAAISFSNDNTSGKTNAFSVSGNRITLGGNVANTLPTLAGTITDTLAVDMILSGTRTFTANSSSTFIHNLIVSGVISESGGSQGLTKAGGGIVTLSGTNTYSGKTTISAGTLSVNTIGNVGAGGSALGAPTNAANGTIDLVTTLIYNGVTASSDRIINLMGSNAQVNNGGAGLLTLSGGITNSAGQSVLFRGVGNVIETGLIATGIGGLTRTDSSILTLSNAGNSFSGGVNILAGTISIDSISNSGTPSALGKGNSIAFGQNGSATLGTLQFTGASGGMCDRAITISSPSGTASGGCIENTVAGQTLTFSGAVNIGGPGPTPQLQLIGAGNGVMSGNIGNVSNSLAITKSGTGTWTLSGANTYTGTTTVSAGTLLVNGSSATGSAFTVAAGASLGGTGTISGTVSAAAGAKLMPGNSGIGTLTLANNSATSLTLNGALLNFKLSNVAATSDLIAVSGASGALVLNGANTITLSTPFGTAPAGIYTLMTYSAKTGGGTLALDHLYPNATLTVGATSVTLTVTGTGTAAAMIWQGGLAANAWDTTTANWVPSTYADNEAVLFDDTGSDSPAVNITPGAVAPASVTVNASTRAYTIGGAAIGGMGGLTKSGAATLILSGTNTYTGTTLVTAGTLKLGGTSGNVLSDVSTLSLAGGTFDLADRTETVTNFTVTGNAVLTSTGAGSGVLSSTNNAGTASTVAAGGTLTITSGTLNETAYFVNSGTVTISGGTLSIVNELLNGYITGGAVVNLNSGVILGTMISFGGNATCIYRFNGGTLQCNYFKRRSTSAADLFFNGVTVQARSTASSNFFPDTAATAGQNAWISSGGATFDSNGKAITVSIALQHDALGTTVDGGLTKTGTGTLTLSGTNTYNGATTVSNGTLKLASTGSISNSLVISVASGSTCDVSSVTGFAVGSAQTLAGSGVVVGGVTLLGTLAAGGTNSVGVLQVTNFTFAANSAIREDCLNGSADMLQVSGGLTVGANVTVNLNLTGILPTRVALVKLTGAITNPENLNTWSLPGFTSNSRVIWEAATQSIIIHTPKGTVLTVR